MNKIIIMRMVQNAVDELPLEEDANAIMNAEDFREYISVHGYHFTPKLADYASSLLVNADSSHHHWTTEQVKGAIGISELPNGHTWGDVAYVANWIYSDYFPSYIRSESDILGMTRLYIKDPDGYEGMFFMRWLSDLIGKKQNANWADFI